LTTTATTKAVFFSVVDPNPLLSFVLDPRAWKLTKFKNKPEFLPFKKATYCLLSPTVGIFFKCKNSTFCKKKTHSYLEACLVHDLVVPDDFDGHLLVTPRTVPGPEYK
jgi:hypothetical protein